MQKRRSGGDAVSAPRSKKGETRDENCKAKISAKGNKIVGALAIVLFRRKSVLAALSEREAPAHLHQGHSHLLSGNGKLIRLELAQSLLLLAETIPPWPTCRSTG